MSDEGPDGDLPELVDRCLVGDEGALLAFVRRYERAVFGLCLRMLRDRHEAEDVAQETFVRAVRSLDRWDRGRPILPWLQTIAANRCRTALGKRTRRPVTAISLPDTGVEQPSMDEAEEVELAVSQLPENWQTAIRMHYQGDLSCQEIADAMGCAEGTVKTWLFRGRKQLAEILQEREVLNERAGVVE